MSVRNQMDRSCKTGWVFALGCVAGMIAGVLIGYGFALQILLEDQRIVSMFIGQGAGFAK